MASNKKDDIFKDDYEKFTEETENIGEKEIEEDLLEMEEIQAKIDSGEAFYLPEKDGGNLPEIRMIYCCPRCRRVFFNNRWVKDNITDLFTVRTEMAICGKCLKKGSDSFVGCVEIFDENVAEKKEEIINLAEEVAGNLENSPPFEKIIQCVEKEGVLFIFTNTTRLAMQIGREIRDRFLGGIQFEWFERNQYLRVKWFDSLSKRDNYNEQIRKLKELRFGVFPFEEDI